MTSVILFAIGVLIIIGLWATGHPAIIDRPTPDRRNGFDRHSLGHVGLSLIIGIICGVFNGFVAGVVVPWTLMFLVEIAQKNPRDRQGGFFEIDDILCNTVGAITGGWIGSLFHPHVAHAAQIPIAADTTTQNASPAVITMWIVFAAGAALFIAFVLYMQRKHRR